MSASLGRRLGLRLRVVVDAFGLEEDGPVGMSPEVGDGVAAVSAARLKL